LKISNKVKDINNSKSHFYENMCPCDLNIHMNKRYRFKCPNCGGDTLVCVSRVLMHEIVDSLELDSEADIAQITTDVECDRYYESVLNLYCEECGEKWEDIKDVPKELVNNE
jgi:predicted RNA-binding Zn-ribbon protein involved in translation (DUF1610 family)